MSKLLLIHPDKALLGELSLFLREQGHEVDIADDGAEGIRLVYQLQPELIIAGIMGHEVNGYQICRLVKNDPATKHIPFVLISNFHEKVEKFWGIKAGADLFLHVDEVKIKLPKQIQSLLEMYSQLPKLSLPVDLKGHPMPAQFSTRLNQILDTALIESTLMIDFRNLVDMVHEPNLLNHMLFSFLEGILDYDAAAIFYNDKMRSPRVVTFHFPDDKAQHPDQVEVLKNAFFAPLQQQFPNDTLFQMLEDEVIGSVDETVDAKPYQTVYTRVFYQDNELIGVLCLYRYDVVDYTNIFPVRLIEDEIRLLMKVRHIYSKAEMLAVTDDLTGLFNYNQFMMTLDREFRASKRYEHSLSLAIIDVDFIDKYNARWGYTEGDQLIKKLAETTRISFRGVDVVARTGGVELVVMFPKTESHASLTALSRFQERVHELAGLKEPITVSIGLAAFDPAMEKPSDLMTRARLALDLAVKNGRNRIEMLTDIPAAH